MRKLFTLFVAILTTTVLWAYDFYVSGICYNNLGGYRVEVASGYKRYQSHSYVDSIFIPATVTNEDIIFDVVGIGDEAFKSNPNLGYTCNISYVFIPNSVTSIGNSAFSGCSGLTSIAIPNSVTSIGDYAFSSCSLTSITIPENVTSVGEYAFNCSSLTSVNWEAKNVDDCRISPFNNITSIIFGDNVKSIPKSVCYGCNSLSSVIISNSVNTIGLSAFRYCNSLTSVSIGNSVTNIEGCAFQDCTSLTSITLPNSVTSIGAQTFSGCTSLTSINIPSSVTSIGQYAFSGCSALNSLILGEGVNSIGNYAFAFTTNTARSAVPAWRLIATSGTRTLSTSPRLKIARANIPGRSLLPALGMVISTVKVRVAASIAG